MSDRDLTSGMVDALQEGTLRPVLFYEGFFDSSGSEVPLRLWTGRGSYDWNGHTWVGDGQMVQISGLSETVDLEAKGFSITVTGLDSANISIALTSMRASRNKAGTLWLGLFDEDGALIADPYRLQRGRFSHPKISASGANTTIEATYLSILTLLGSSEERRYTDEDQHRDYPTDLGFEMVPALQDVDFNLFGGAAA